MCKVVVVKTALTWTRVPTVSLIGLENMALQTQVAPEPTSALRVAAAAVR